ncbi:MAG: type II toxin-antitoxin system ParD family antitoxin [Tepidisphaeraceae bacterium]
MNISLTPQLEAFVKQRVDSGQYQSSSEVVREALRLMDERDRERRAALRAVKTKVASGLAQLRRGEGRDGDEVFRELLAGLPTRGRAKRRAVAR